MYFHFEPIYIATCNSLFNNFYMYWFWDRRCDVLKLQFILPTYILHKTDWNLLINKPYENYIISKLTYTKYLNLERCIYDINYLNNYDSKPLDLKSVSMKLLLFATFFHCTDGHSGYANTIMYLNFKIGCIGIESIPVCVYTIFECNSSQQNVIWLMYRIFFALLIITVAIQISISYPFLALITIIPIQMAPFQISADIFL